MNNKKEEENRRIRKDASDRKYLKTKKMKIK